MDPASIQTRIRAVAEDRTSGASALARHCLQIGADSALYFPAKDTPSLIETLAAQAAEMAASRPSMAPVHQLLSRWRREVEGLHSLDLDTARRRAANAAAVIASLSHDAVRRLAQHARELIGDGQCIITHSLSSTLEEVFSGLRERGIRVIVSESRPLFEGRRLAKKLSGWGFDTTLITDAEMGLFVAEANVVLVGADSLLEDGSVVNKVGTYLLAVAARDRSVPFYVCCESFKQRSPDMGALELEEMSPAELGAADLTKVNVRNVYFDITPRRFITGWVNEEGVTELGQEKAGRSEV